MVRKVGSKMGSTSTNIIPVGLLNIVLKRAALNVFFKTHRISLGVAISVISLSIAVLSISNVAEHLLEASAWHVDAWEGSLLIKFGC